MQEQGQVVTDDQVIKCPPILSNFSIADSTEECVILEEWITVYFTRVQWILKDTYAF